MMYDLALSFVSGAVIGWVLGLFGKEKWLERKIKRLESENEELGELLYSAEQRERSAKGLEARKDNKDRRDAAMAEFMLAMKEGKQFENVVKELAGKYPDVALDLAKKGLKL